MGKQESTDVDTAVLQSFYKQVSDIVGAEAMLEIWETFRGTQITIPIHLYDRELVKAVLPRQYNGSNARVLANRYGYSEKWVRQVLKASKQVE